MVKLERTTSDVVMGLSNSVLLLIVFNTCTVCDNNSVLHAQLSRVLYKHSHCYWLATTVHKEEREYQTLYIPCVSSTNTLCHWQGAIVHKLSAKKMPFNTLSPSSLCTLATRLTVHTLPRRDHPVVDTASGHTPPPWWMSPGSCSQQPLSWPSIGHGAKGWGRAPDDTSGSCL